MNFIVTVLYDGLSRLNCFLGHALDFLLDALGGGWCCLAERFGFITFGRGVGLVLAFISVNLVFAVLLDEVCKVLDGAGAGVEDGFRLAAGGEKFDRGEALNLIGHVIECGVNLGDCHLFVEGGMAGIEGGKLNVFGGKAKYLSVALHRAKWFDKHTLYSGRTMERKTQLGHLYRCL